ncbi:MAG TPA: ABC transporter permease [Bryobacteraceae bacterium]|nr:ABC transporter permease [Bryobacteraceae bacterium]
MYELLRDWKHTLRRLAATPGFTLATIATLALGIGANTAIFSIVNSVILKPLPFTEPDRLIGVWQTAPGVNIENLNASIADYVTYREDSTTFADVALWNGRSLTVTEFAEPERVDGITSTLRLFPMLGIQPILGRQFEEKDFDTKGPDVLMISYGYWQRRFGGDSKIIGRTLRAENSVHEIIGVLPEKTWFMDMRHDIVTPLRFDRASVQLAGYNQQAIARLRPGVTLEQANADVARMIAIQPGKFPPPNGMSLKMLADARLAPNVRGLREDLLGDIGKSLWVVMATIGIVLLIACANVANLLLVRTGGRSQELAVRAALGATRVRIARELLLESLTLSLLGGGAGIAMAMAAVQFVVKTSPVRMPRLEQISVDATALFFTLAISVVAGLTFGLFPVLKHGGIRVAEALRAGGRNASDNRDRNLARNVLTVVQVALALVLLIGSGLMIRTFQSIRNVHPGFQNPENIQALRVSAPRSAVPKEEDLRRLQQSLATRLASLPGVASVGIITGLPMTNTNSQDPIFASDRTYNPDQIPPLRRFISTGPGAFQALGVSLLAGRDYTWTDIQEQRRLAVISDNFAREYWGSPQAAIGKQIRSFPSEPWSEVIGVVGDIRHDGSDKKAPTAVYWPLRDSYSVHFLLRGVRAGTESLTAELRQAVAAVNPALPVTDVRTMKEVYDRSMSRTAFTLALLAISGGMALLLAVVGIYAVISYTVAQRTKEIGIRLALGAQQRTIKLMFVRNGVILGSVGAAVGLAAAAVLSQLMSSLLFEINPVDPLTYLLVAAGLLAAAAIASYLPSRRLSRLDPLDALRAD